MFSGIIEETTSVCHHDVASETSTLTLNRPQTFDDIRLGDSISINGVCLTVEKFDDQQMTFCLSHETHQITHWDKSLKEKDIVNVERSLRLGDRIHGHLVSGHVDEVGIVKEVQKYTETCDIYIKISHPYQKFLWQKGSVAINGVSLTVNAIDDGILKLTLIPETLKRTNLGELQVGDAVTVEYDYYAKALLNSRELSC